MIQAFGEIYDKAPGIIAATEGPGHRFTYTNAAYRKFVGRQELVGKSVAEALPEAQAQGFVALLDQVYATGEPYVAKNAPIKLNIGNNGEETLRYVSFIYQPVRGPDGLITGLFLEGYDSTAEVVAQKRLSVFQEDLSHAARVNTMGMMAATLAHELNQPLTAVSAYASASVRLLQSGNPEPERLAEALRAIGEATQRAGAIIRNIREFTKRGETSKSVFDLKTAVEESIALVKAGACPRSELVGAVPGEMLVEANLIQITQVIVNLLRNACEAAHPGRANRVEVTAMREGSKIIVTVRDEGRGLSAEEAQNIFTWTDSEKEGGTGLGLAICRAILDANDGRIWLEKAGPGGCDFRFSLPSASSD